MKKTQKNQSKQHRSPKQQRSQFTVSAILEAATHVFSEKGLNKATTNEIAERAGVSIGSLYQYFPNKQSLIVELTQQHLTEMTDQITTGMDGMLELGAEQSIETLVRLMIDAHSTNPDLHRVLIEDSKELLAESVIEEFENKFFNLAKGYLALVFGNKSSRDLNIVAFVLINSLEALTHKAVLEKNRYPQLLKEGKDHYVAEITHLLCAYLKI